MTTHRHSAPPRAVIVLLAMAGAGLVAAYAVTAGLVPGSEPPGSPRSIGSAADLAPGIAGPPAHATPSQPTISPQQPGPVPPAIGAAVAAPSPTVRVIADSRTCPPEASPDGFALHVPVLMYHRVIAPALAGSSLPGLVVPPPLFDAQLAALHAAGWRSITLAALAADLAARREPPPRTFVITIDDGHEDGFTDALPILRRYGDVGTYFIVTGRLGEPDDLSAAQVRTLAADGMEIADHTVDHVDLRSLPVAVAQLQIELAASTIAGLVGRRPTTFAYPYGAYDRRVAVLLHEDGFAMAVTTEPCAYESSATALVTPRLRVGPGTSPASLVAEVTAAGRRAGLPPGLDSHAERPGQRG